MALAEGVREIVDATARSHGATRVRAVRLEVGALSQVETHALRFAFDVVRRGTLAAQARVEIVETPGTAWCMLCSDTVSIARRGDGCPRCGHHQLQVTGGDRMRVLDIEIDSDEENTACA